MNFLRTRLFIFLLIFFQFSTLLSCKTRYDLRKEKDVAAKILDDLSTKKIVFLGENHDDVYPILFLKKHLEDFYNAGLRYLFFETGDDGYLPDSNMNEYDFEIVPPWCLYAWKYEQHLLEKEIKRINESNKTSPIRVFWPEYNLELPETNDAVEILNFRDEKIQEGIISTLENTKKSDKAIVLYGADHGAIKPEKSYLGNKLMQQWKTTGVYLKDYFGEDFAAYRFFQFDSNEYENVIYSKSSDCVVLSGKNLEQFVPDAYRDSFDNIATYKEAVYGVIYPYINSSQNFSVLAKKATDFTSKSKYSRTNALFAIYYFNYLTCSKINFDVERINTENIESFQKIKDESAVPDIASLEDYAKYLYAQGLIEDYLYDPANDNRIKYIMNNMVKAKEINPKDIWPQYWISYFSTEKAMYSGRKKEYRKALSEWKELLKNDLVYASPVLKLVYKKMAFCEQQLGNYEGQHFYSEKEKKVSSLLDFDYKEYVYFGY